MQNIFSFLTPSQEIPFFGKGIFCKMDSKTDLQLDSLVDSKNMFPSNPQVSYTQAFHIARLSQNILTAGNPYTCFRLKEEIMKRQTVFQ